MHRVIETFATEATREIDARRCLVLAPHPDDEVLGCGGTIARKVQQGTHVSIAYLTDGRHGVAAPPEEASVLREAEAVSAAAVLGLPAERLTFFRFEDGRLGDHIEQAIDRIRQMVAMLDVTALFVPYRREFHADHLAAWQIGNACCGDGMRLYEYPIWYGPWLWPRLRGQARVAAACHLADVIHAVKVRIADVVDIKKRAWAAHHSQALAFEALGSWGSEFVATLTGSYELFFTRR